MCCDTTPNETLATAKCKDPASCDDPSKQHCCSCGGGRTICPSSWGKWATDHCICDHTKCTDGGGRCQNDQCVCHAFQIWDETQKKCICQNDRCGPYAGGQECKAGVQDACTCDTGVNWNAVEKRCEETMALYNSLVFHLFYAKSRKF